MRAPKTPQADVRWTNSARLPGGQNRVEEEQSTEASPLVRSMTQSCACFRTARAPSSDTPAACWCRCRVRHGWHGHDGDQPLNGSGPHGHAVAAGSRSEVPGGVSPRQRPRPHPARPHRGPVAVGTTSGQVEIGSPAAAPPGRTSASARGRLPPPRHLRGHRHDRGDDAGDGPCRPGAIVARRFPVMILVMIALELRICRPSQGLGADLAQCCHRYGFIWSHDCAMMVPLDEAVREGGSEHELSGRSVAASEPNEHRVADG